MPMTQQELAETMLWSAEADLKTETDPINRQRLELEVELARENVQRYRDAARADF